MGGDASNDDSNNMYSPEVSAASTQNNSQGKTSSPSLYYLEAWQASLVPQTLAFKLVAVNISFILCKWICDADNTKCILTDLSWFFCRVTKNRLKNKNMKNKNVYFLLSNYQFFYAKVIINILHFSFFSSN